MIKLAASWRMVIVVAHFFVILGAAFVCNEFVGKAHEPFGVLWVGDLGSDECIPRPMVRQTSAPPAKKLESAVGNNFTGSKTAVQSLDAVSVHPDSGSWGGSRCLLDLLYQHFFTVHWLCLGPDRLSVGPVLQTNRDGFRGSRDKDLSRGCAAAPVQLDTHGLVSQLETHEIYDSPADGRLGVCQARLVARHDDRALIHLPCHWVPVPTSFVSFCSQPTAKYVAEKQQPSHSDQGQDKILKAGAGTHGQTEGIPS